MWYFKAYDYIQVQKPLFEHISQIYENEFFFLKKVLENFTSLLKSLQIQQTQFNSFNAVVSICFTLIRCAGHIIVNKTKLVESFSYFLEILRSNF